VLINCLAVHLDCLLAADLVGVTMHFGVSRAAGKLILDTSESSTLDTMLAPREPCFLCDFKCHPSPRNCNLNKRRKSCVPATCAGVYMVPASSCQGGNLNGVICQVTHKLGTFEVNPPTILVPHQRTIHSQTQPASSL